MGRVHPFGFASLPQAPSPAPAALASGARRVALLACALAIFGCGGSSSSNNGGGFRDGGANGGGGGNGDGNSTERPADLPDPGKPPAGASGIFIFSYMQKNDGAEEFSVAGRFQTPAQNLAASGVQEFLKGYPSVPVDTCVDLNRGLQTQSSDQPTLLDGGDVRLFAPAGEVIPVRKQTVGTFIFYQATLPQTAFAPAKKFELQGGSDFQPVKPFRGDFYSPPALRMTKPALPVDKALKVARNQPFAVEWEPSGAGGAVLLYLTQKDKTLTCRLNDDGAFEIPARTLSQLGSSNAPGGPQNNQPDTLSLQRYTWYAIRPESGESGESGGPDVANVVSFEVGATLEVSFE
jgi:hypothetical protein